MPLGPYIGTNMIVTLSWILRRWSEIRPEYKMQKSSTEMRIGLTIVSLKSLGMDDGFPVEEISSGCFNSLAGHGKTFFFQPYLALGQHKPLAVNAVLVSVHP